MANNADVETQRKKMWMISSAMRYAQGLRSQLHAMVPNPVPRLAEGSEKMQWLQLSSAASHIQGEKVGMRGSIHERGACGCAPDRFSFAKADRGKMSAREE